jgi:hypothetical protein
VSLDSDDSVRIWTANVLPPVKSAVVKPAKGVAGKMVTVYGIRERFLTALPE